MFPNTITIYRHSTEEQTTTVNNQSVTQDVDVYSKQILKGVYAVQNITLSQSQKGVEQAKPTTIITSPENAQNYGVKWNIKAKDRIVLGVGSDITSFDDIPDALIVQGIEINVIGSDCDNITITAA